MATKFAGFKPETLKLKIVPALGYDGPTDEKSINAFLAASPAAAAKMGRYTMIARQMVEGRPINEERQGFAAGGSAGAASLTKQALADPTKVVTKAAATPTTPAQIAAGSIGAGAGQAAPAPQATPQQAAPAAAAPNAAPEPGSMISKPASPKPKALKTLVEVI